MKKLWIVILVILTIMAILIYFNISRNKTQISNIVPQKENTVEISNFSFVPESIKIKKGTAVTWINMDQSTHDIKIGDQVVSQKMGIGESFSYIFNESGEINYTCGIHTSMVGKIVVE